MPTGSDMRTARAFFTTALLNPAFVAVALLLAAPTAGAVRVKELADVQGMRDNELFGYGLVVGLGGTGDTENVFFTSQSISGMLGRLGIRVDPREVRVRNVAAVMVTARLPSYARPGTKLDVTVGAMGNARSLEGGVLLLTPLAAADGTVYAVAQGAVQVGGFLAVGQASQFRKNYVNSGRIPSGASVERSVSPDIGAGPIVLELKRPDFTTALRMAEAIGQSVEGTTAKAVDAGRVEVPIGRAYEANPVLLLARLEEVQVESDQRAKVVVSERTGTVVAGDRVRIRPVAVAHGGLQVSISNSPVFNQPAPFSNTPALQGVVTQVEQKEERAAVLALEATTTVDELASALNKLGVTARDLVIILQAIRAAGALDGDLEVL
jgi:flagellar P-ring protein precursor FlgI